MAKSEKVHFSAAKVSKPNLAPNSGGWLDSDNTSHITRKDKTTDTAKLSKSKPRTAGPWYFGK
ncbi:MAG: hypothetical protein WB607_06165 [Candidatus Acidiferrum sp.]